MQISFPSAKSLKDGVWNCGRYATPLGASRGLNDHQARSHRLEPWGVAGMDTVADLRVSKSTMSPEKKLRVNMRQCGPSFRTEIEVSLRFEEQHHAQGLIGGDCRIQAPCV